MGKRRSGRHVSIRRNFRGARGWKTHTVSYFERARSSCIRERHPYNVLLGTLAAWHGVPEFPPTGEGCVSVMAGRRTKIESEPTSPCCLTDCGAYQDLSVHLSCIQCHLQVRKVFARAPGHHRAPWRAAVSSAIQPHATLSIQRVGWHTWATSDGLAGVIYGGIRAVESEHPGVSRGAPRVRLWMLVFSSGLVLTRSS